LKRHSKDGVYAGTLVLHPWRKRHEDGTECEMKGCRLLHIWVWGPHVHYCGHGFFSSSDKFYEQTGWVYKNIKPKESNTRSIKDTVGYLLTHCAVFREYRSVEVYDSLNMVKQVTSPSWVTVGQHYRYVGLFSNAKGGHKVLEQGVKTVECNKCECLLHKYLTDGDDLERDHDLGEYEVPYKKVEYYLNIKRKKVRSRVVVQMLIDGVDINE